MNNINTVEHQPRIRKRSALNLRFAAVACVCTVVGAAAWICILLAGHPFDDALIHKRIALHLVQAGTPWFNLDDQAMATSAPAWTLLLAAFIYALPENSLVLAMSFVQAGAVAAGLLAWLGVLRLLVPSLPSSATIAFTITYCGLVIEAAAGGMETPLALAILALGYLSALRGSAWALGLFAIAPFFRLELSLASAFGVIWVVVRGHVQPRTALLCAVTVVTASAILLQAAFGTMIPQAARAKSLVYDLSATEVWKQLGQPLGGFFRNAGYLPIFGAAAILVYAAMRIKVRRSGLDFTQVPVSLGAITALVIGLGVIGVYCAGGALFFPWYLPLYGVPLALGLLLVAYSSSHQSMRLAAGMSFVVLLGGQAGVMIKAVSAAAGNFADWPRFEETARVRLYQRIGAHLDASKPDATLMAAEIGGLGAGFRGSILDGIGLASPEVLAYHPMRVPGQRKHKTLGAIPRAWFEHRKPDFVVAYDVFAEELLKSPLLEVYDEYRCGILLPEDLKLKPNASLFGAHTLHVFVRKGITSQLVLEDCGCTLVVRIP